MVHVKGIALFFLTVLLSYGIAKDQTDEPFSVNVVKQNAIWRAPDEIESERDLVFHVNLDFVEKESVHCNFTFGKSTGDQAVDLKIAETVVEHTHLFTTGLTIDPNNVERIIADVEVSEVDKGLFIVLVYPTKIGNASKFTKITEPAALAINGDEVTLLRPVGGGFTFY